MKRLSDRALLWVILAFVGSALIALTITGGLFIHSSHSTDNHLASNVADINRTRAEARAGVCAQDQGQAELAIVNSRDQAQGLANAMTATVTKTPELKAAIKAFVDSQEALARTTYKQRDCTPAGIAAFYNNAPPAMPCANGTDGKGYCK